ncbi:MAG: type I-E CRISPR-associated endonuclease Cas1e [Armatimonadota bacterium]
MTRDTKLKDLHLLPKIKDSLSFLYVEHAKIDKHDQAIAIHDADSMTPVPVASLAVLMLGPGTTITHAAINALADNNCLVIWCGEENVRFYACGIGGTRSANRLLRQARLASSETSRLQVVKRMYRMRFEEEIPEETTVDALRGMEGARVRQAYSRLSAETGVDWNGRNYDRQNWQAADVINRAISAANSCLYGLCHAAILSAGYSPAIGFIHTGKQLSFVYDIADLYKVDFTVPLAFKMAADPPAQLERSVRLACRDAFKEMKLVSRIIPDIKLVLGEVGDEDETSLFDSDEALPAELWLPSWEVQDKVTEDDGTDT